MTDAIESATISSLAEWSSNRPNWVKAIVNEATECKRPIDDAALDRIFSGYLVENGLADGEASSVELAPSVGAAPAEKPILRLDKLIHISGVNALKAPSELEFNPKMTLVFGENAAGKSGYVRILKALSSARCKEEILPPTDEEAPPPKAISIAFTVGDTSDQVDWDFEESIDALSDIDVFDSRFAQIHVDQRLEYTYTPSEVAAFPIVSNAIRRVREKLLALTDATLMYQSNFQSGIPEGVSFRATLAEVSSSTNVDHLRTLAMLTAEEIAEFERLQEAITTLQSADATAAIKQAAQDTALLVEASAAYSSIKDFDWERFDNQIGTLSAAKQTYASSGLQDLEAPSPGAETQEWRDFIEAGEKLIQAHVGPDYPADGSECIYCGQELDEEATALLKRYRAYCTGELKTAVEIAAAEVAKCSSHLQGLDIPATVAKLTARADAEQGASRDIWTEITKHIRYAEAARDKICTGSSVLLPEREQFSNEAVSQIENLRAQISRLAEALGGENSQRSEELAKAKAGAAEFEARKSLAGMLDQIAKSVRAAQWCKSAQEAHGKFTQVLRSLTVAAKAASQVLLNDGFEERFDEECKKLHAPRVKLAFPGDDARVERRKFISDRYAISQILSEGEQKAVALADFLAESRLRTSSSPIAFDDPVNSLDYKRIRYVASRLAELSNDRQIIVFTHNIWFATEILSHFDDRQADCSYYDIEASDAVKGILSKGNSPRTDSFNRNKPVINELIQGAASLSGEAKQALIERGYEYLRNTCEVIVEKEYFRGVSRRYEPNIRMTTLEQINYDRLQEACSKTFDIFEECCRKIASHSQPIETLNVRPTLDDLKRDWEALQGVRSAYLAN